VYAVFIIYEFVDTQQIAQSCSCNTRRPSSKYKAVNTQHLSHLFPKARYCLHAFKTVWYGFCNFHVLWSTRLHTRWQPS